MLKQISIFALGILIFIILVPLSAAVFMMLWNIFVTPLGMPKIGLINSAGIFLIIGMFNYPKHEKSEDDNIYILILSPFAKLAFITVYAIILVMIRDS